MFSMKSFLLIICLNSCFLGYTQSADTITLMSYNLLNFPDGRNDCGSNTIVPMRYDTLKKIIDYVKPDIFVACEVQVKHGADSVLTRSLNTNGNQNYAMANWVPSSGGGDLNNILFYNTTKLQLLWQDEIQNSTRDINHYVLFALDPNLANHFDTTFYEVFMCHLKSGNSTVNKQTRAEQVILLRDYIDTRPADHHFFVCGDLNVYTSSEPAYQGLTSGGSNPMFDPISSPGNWNNNASFKAIHTQSTRSSGNFDCGSTGGLDDRFDQILVSQNVLSGTDSVKYINGSYKAIGNDGNHFNNSMNTGSNSQYPDSIVDALFFMSDHLPVVMKTRINYPLTNGLALNPSVINVKCNGQTTGQATINANAGLAPYTYQWDAAAGNQTTQTISNLAAGSYCVTVTDDLGEVDEFCVYISQPIPMVYNNFTSASTFDCNGSCAVLVTGGAIPYTYSWSIPGVGNSNVADSLCPGNYTCTVTDTNGCTIVSNIVIIDQSVGIEKLDFSKEILVYPNPSNGKFFIQNKSHVDWAQFELKVFNLDGREVKALQVNGLKINERIEIDVENLKSGVYFIGVDDYFGGQLKIRKL